MEEGKMHNIFCDIMKKAKIEQPTRDMFHSHVPVVQPTGSTDYGTRTTHKNHVKNNIEAVFESKKNIQEQIHNHKQIVAMKSV